MSFWKEFLKALCTEKMWLTALEPASAYIVPNCKHFVWRWIHVQSLLLYSSYSIPPFLFFYTFSSSTFLFIWESKTLIVVHSQQKKFRPPKPRNHLPLLMEWHAENAALLETMWLVSDWRDNSKTQRYGKCSWFLLGLVVDLHTIVGFLPYDRSGS